MAGQAKIKGIYGGAAAKKMDIPVTPDLLQELGTCLVNAFIKEAKVDFAKRGWSGVAHDGSAPIWESFSFHIKGESTIEVTSTYPGIEEMTSKGGIPPRKMTWLTQEAKDRSPSKYGLTAREQRRASKGGRLPLVVPIKKKGSGQVLFRTAPLKTADAWIHPGIARFTFIERAVKKGRADCLEIIKREAVKAFIKSFNR